MNFKKETIEKFNKAIPYYLECKSKEKASKKYKFCSYRFSKYLQSIGIEVINYQNLQTINENIFEIIDNEEKAYWLGFMYADGCVSKKRQRVELTIQIRDLKHLEKFKAFLGYDKPIHLTKKTNACRVSFNNSKIRSDLINLGCIPQKSLKLKFPSDKKVPKELKRHFLRGYFDGDGSVRILKGRHFYTGNLQVIGTKEFLLGIVKLTKWRFKKLYKNKALVNNTYSLNWNGQYVLDYLHFLYKDSNVSLDRKYDKYKEIERKSICRF